MFSFFLASFSFSFYFFVFLFFLLFFFCIIFFRRYIRIPALTMFKQKCLVVLGGSDNFFANSLQRSKAVVSLVILKVLKEESLKYTRTTVASSCPVILEEEGERKRRKKRRQLNEATTKD